MVQEQIIARGITDPEVINAMQSVRRHLFVPAQLAGLAYNDYPLPIGEGQTISQPYIVALMTEKIAVNRNDKVLEIGTGSGYQAAVLSLIAGEVYSIEIVPELAQSAAELLLQLGYKNVYVRCGDGFLGWPAEAPFSAIVITCATASIPEPLVSQLAEGGRIILPLGDDIQILTVLLKKDGELLKQDIIPVRFVPMKGMIEEIEQ